MQRYVAFLDVAACRCQEVVARVAVKNPILVIANQSAKEMAVPV